MKNKKIFLKKCGSQEKEVPWTVAQSSCLEPGEQARNRNYY